MQLNLFDMSFSLKKELQMMGCLLKITQFIIQTKLGPEIVCVFPVPLLLISVSPLSPAISISGISSESSRFLYLTRDEENEERRLKLRLR